MSPDCAHLPTSPLTAHACTHHVHTREGAQACTHARFRRYQKQIIAKVLQRWLVAFMRPAFEAWQEIVQERARKLELCQRVGRRWMLHEMYGVFDLWLGMVEDKRKLKRYVAGQNFFSHMLTAVCCTVSKKSSCLKTTL